MKRALAGLLALLVTTVVMALPSAEPGVTQDLAAWRTQVISDIHYQLAFSVPEDPGQAIPARVGINFQLADDTRPLQLDFRESADLLRRVTVNGKASRFEFSNEHISIPAAELREGQNRVEIELHAGTSSLNRNPDYLFTLLVPDRARTVFPLFDQPDLKARFTLELTVPADWRVLANSEVTKSKLAENRVTHHFATSDLIPSYLFSFVAGRFESVTRTRNGRRMTMLHRETDTERLNGNVDTIFDLHAEALTWLESYTGIDYPFQKLDFVLIPAFPYRGMEHVGAIQYRAEALLLEANATETEMLDRASLIAHEVAHAWFGNLVTMRWFDDVWTKEVFANFMAARMVNPAFPDIDHELRFLLDHYPEAYGVDRTEGANAIRQELPNLNEAGSLYGAIIYHKAPIMMRQLESLMGEDAFRKGIRNYLEKYAFDNASWPDLISILDGLSDHDLGAWSEVWVNSPGRASFSAVAREDEKQLISQADPAGRDRVWPQAFEISAFSPGTRATFPIASDHRPVEVPAPAGQQLLFNADGRGYGQFPAEIGDTALWPRLTPLEKGSLLINLYENLLDGRLGDPADYLDSLLQLLTIERDEQLIELMLAQLRPVFWNLLPNRTREQRAAAVEATLWRSLEQASSPGTQRLIFLSLSELATTESGIARVYGIWTEEENIRGLELSERDRVSLSQLLAIKRPALASEIVARQLDETDNPDTRRELEFLAPSVAAEQKNRDAFFRTLADPQQRETEKWVLSALANLHHPLRREASVSYIQPSLELLEEIQRTGDIFFPAGWLAATLRNHISAQAAQTVRRFLAERPGYNTQLTLKLLQAADPLFRAVALRNYEPPRPQRSNDKDGE